MITSTKNRQVTAAAKLRKRGLREQYRLFLAEGAQAVEEGLSAGAVERLFHVPPGTGRIPSIVAHASQGGVPVVAVSEAVMGHLTSTVTPQGIVAVTRFVDGSLEEASRGDGPVPVLCSVRDPGNAGTILRSADAAGAGGVVFTIDSVDVYNAKTVRASAGSLFHLPVVREVTPSQAVTALRAGGARVLAAAADGDHSVYDVELTGPTAILFGNEAWGLPPEVRGLADASIRVPIAGRAESLNLAAAAALVLFEAARQRAGATATAGDRFPALVARGAHDLRLPLTAFKGFSAVLAGRWDSLDDAQRRDLVRGMRLDAERVSAQVTMLVDAALLESGGIRLDRSRHDLGDVARWVAEVYATSPGGPEAVVEGTGTATFDRDRVRAVLLAVCDAALWWGDGPLHLEVGPSAEGAGVTVVRRGGGPSSAEAAAAMDDREGPIGLVLSRRLVEAAGGSLTVEPGEAVRIHLELPA
ncbi:MAG: TrmH family RNA methyltransferase [Actinomycetota bacterium]